MVSVSNHAGKNESIGKLQMPQGLRMTCAIFLSLFPHAVFAHERWFFPSELPAQKSLFLLGQSGVLILLIVALIGAAVAWFLHRKVKNHRHTQKIHSALSRYSAWTEPILRTLTGLFLFSASLGRFLFAPDLMINISDSAAIFLHAELVLGIVLILGVLPRLAAFLSLILYIITFFYFPFHSVIAYVSVAGLLFYIFVKGDQTLPRTHSFFSSSVGVPLKRIIDFLQPYAFFVLRITTGFSLAYVGLYYKILNPAYSLAFLQVHDINFMQHLGFTFFTPELFIAAAGFIEVLIGVCIAAGIFTRLFSLILIGIMTLTAALFGILELLGHLPLYASAFAFLVRKENK